MAVDKRTTVLLKEIAPWKVADYASNVFKGQTLDDLRRLLAIPRLSAPARRVLAKETADTHFPDYDPRVGTECVHGVIDQGACTSGWAIAIAHSMSDKYCRAGRRVAADLAPQYILSCDGSDYGCLGGYLIRGFEFMAVTGTAAEYCTPYSSYYSTLEKCPAKCKGGEKLQLYGCKTGSIRDLSYNRLAMMREILDKGSVAATMAVFIDFIYYSGGIYSYVSGEIVGRQALRLIGYGTEGGSRYWIGANSWGERWGEKGFFKIAMGECEIEEDVWTCDPDI